MAKQLRNKIFNQQIVTSAIIGLMLLTLSGCQQVNNLANSNGNTNAPVEQANSSANSNTGADKTLKNNLIGTWIGTSEDNKLKVVFTENELTQYSGDKIDGTGKYKFVDGQTIEFTDEKTGNTSRQEATVEGDELTVIIEGKPSKFKRESSTAQTEPAANLKYILAQTLSGHGAEVNSVAFSPDGKTLASGSHDNTIKLWDVASGTNTQTLSGHGGVYSVAFSPDGKMLASGSYDKTNQVVGHSERREHTNIIGSQPFCATGSIFA